MWIIKSVKRTVNGNIVSQFRVFFLHVTKIHRTLADLIYQQLGMKVQLAFLVVLFVAASKKGGAHTKRLNQLFPSSDCRSSNALGWSIYNRKIAFTSKYSINQLDFLHTRFFFLLLKDNLAVIKVCRRPKKEPKKMLREKSFY